MKTTHKRMIIEFFESHGNRATLGQLIEAGQGTFQHELRARLSNLRADGHKIECVRGEKAGENLYVFTNRMAPKAVDETGQTWFIPLEANG